MTPHLFLSFTTCVRSWRPKFEHHPAVYGVRSGLRFSQPATSVAWGPFRACVVWP